MSVFHSVYRTAGVRSECQDFYEGSNAPIPLSAQPAKHKKSNQRNASRHRYAFFPASKALASSSANLSSVANSCSAFFFANSLQNLLFARITSPYFKNINGITPNTKLTNPSRLHAHAIPSRSYIGLAANGRITANRLREHDAAAIALAEKIS